MRLAAVAVGIMLLAGAVEGAQAQIMRPTPPRVRVTPPTPAADVVVDIEAQSLTTSVEASVSRPAELAFLVIRLAPRGADDPARADLESAIAEARERLAGLGVPAEDVEVTMGLQGYSRERPWMPRSEAGGEAEATIVVRVPPRAQASIATPESYALLRELHTAVEGVAERERQRTTVRVTCMPYFAAPAALPEAFEREAVEDARKAAEKRVATTARWMGVNPGPLRRISWRMAGWPTSSPQRVGIPDKWAGGLVLTSAPEIELRVSLQLTLGTAMGGRPSTTGAAGRY